jgi:hypothetical protein
MMWRAPGSIAWPLQWTANSAIADEMEIVWSVGVFIRQIHLDAVGSTISDEL